MWMRCNDILDENDTPPMTPPYHQYSSNLLFIVEMKMYVY